MIKCKLLVENASDVDVKNPDIPSDSFLVYYKNKEKLVIDICRGQKMSDVFDFYYDKLGKNSIQKITFSYGKVSPRLWNLPKVEEENKKRGRR